MIGLSAANRNHIIAFLLFAAALATGMGTTGCGGSSNSGGGTVTPPPPPPTAPTVSISVSPSTITIPGGTATLTWTSANATTAVASSSPSGVWSGSQSLNGSMVISSLSTPGTYTYTLTVTGAGGSRSASATLTVQPSGPWISSISPNIIYADYRLIIGNIPITGYNFAAGCVLNLGNFGSLTLANGTDPNQILLNLQIAPSNYIPAFNAVSVTCGTTTSNTVWLAFTGNQNTLAIDPIDSLLLQMQQGTYTNPDGTTGGYVWKFSIGANNALTAAGRILGGGGNGIAFDATTALMGMSMASGPGYTVWWENVATSNPAVIFGTSQTGANNTMAIAAGNGYGCTTDPLGGLLQCFQLTYNATILSVAAGNEPFALAMASLGSEMDAIVYSREDTTLWRVSVPDMTKRGSLALSGIMTSSAAGNASVSGNGWTANGPGGWQLAALNSGPASGTAAFLSSPDGVVVSFDLGTMSEIVRATPFPAKDAYPIRIAADGTHGAIVVAGIDLSAGLTRFVSIDAKTGAVTPLAATIPLLASGLAVSSDGADIYACGWDQCESLPATAASSGGGTVMHALRRVFIETMAAWGSTVMQLFH